MMVATLFQLIWTLGENLLYLITGTHNKILLTELNFVMFYFGVEKFISLENVFERNL